MKITVFTSNRRRHMSLVNRLAAVADEVFAVCECASVLPSSYESPVMREYFTHVTEAEAAVFGEIGFPAANVRVLPIKMGDINGLSMSALSPAMDADYFVVFGSGYIKGELITRLTAGRAINIHMGVSPYFRGSDCNFWAQSDGRPELVGATIHMLSKGLDSGDMLWHALPKPAPYKPFELGMAAVRAAHESLSARIADGSVFSYAPLKQDKTNEIRYSRYTDWTDQAAQGFLDNLPAPEEIGRRLAGRDNGMLYNPFFG